MKLLSLLSIALCIGSACLADHGKVGKANRIIVEIEFTHKYREAMPHVPGIIDLTQDSIVFEILPLERIGMTPEWKLHTVRVVNNRVKLVITTDEPVTIAAPFWYRLSRQFNPGDSLVVHYDYKEKEVFGNQIAFFELQDKIEQVLLHHPGRPDVLWNKIKVADDFFKWQFYYDAQLNHLIHVLEAYKQSVDSVSYARIKAKAICSVEESRVQAFMHILGTIAREAGLSGADLVAICDSTLNRPWGRWLREKGNNAAWMFASTNWYFYQYNRMLVWRQYGFDNMHSDSMNTSAKRRIQYYNSIKKEFKGVLRERLLQYLVADECIKELGYNNPTTQMILNDYYQQPGFPEYKQWMRDYVETKGKKLYSYDLAEVDHAAPNFNLVGIDGNSFSKKDLEGKIALLDFWFSGCTGCVQMTPQLRQVEKALETDPEVVFLSISTDRDRERWIKSIRQKKYTTGTGLNLYTGGQGADHPMLKAYDINSYPSLVMVDPAGDIVFPVPDPRQQGGVDRLVALLEKYRSVMNDGPYIQYEGGQPMAYYIQRQNGMPVVQEKRLQPGEHFRVGTDRYPEFFEVALKKELKSPPVTYAQPTRQLVLSDIEGNFDAFRKLLQGNGVMDSTYNWTFGDGHLVLVGDMVDRGEQVTECLWLIYALEEKAKAAGGYVHFILGNHEIMDISGDLRYVPLKYQDNAKLLGASYQELYGDMSELGRWLRTKNIMEKIGDILYTHAGISRQVNDLPLSLQEMNTMARPYYANRDAVKKDKNNPALMALFNSKLSPFWYRQYFKKDNSPYAIADQQPVIDSSLQKFGVQHIVTGHTVMNDTVSVHYDGKVINVDTKHAMEQSEALLIENNGFYRVDITGRKVLLPVLTEVRKKD